MIDKITEQPRKSKVYISGPISSLKYEVAKSRFARGAEFATSMGFKAINPMTFGEVDAEKPWEQYMREDIKVLLECDAIMMLEGWRDSRGAKIEKFVAEQMGIDVLGQDCLPIQEEPVTEEAQRIVMGARRDSYGHPSEDFNRIATMWSALLGFNISPRQVAHMMICVKLSRECNKYKRDNMVDIAGYALAGYMAQADGR